MTPNLMDCGTGGIDQAPVTESVVDGSCCVTAATRFFRSTGWADLCQGAAQATGMRSSRSNLGGLSRDWLTESFRSDRGELPTDWAVRRAIWGIEARARFDEAMLAIDVRVGREREVSGDDAYLDLGDSAGRAIRINAEGWTVVDSPPVHFMRPAGLLPMPVPSRDGSIALLRRYVNLTDRDFRLLIGWMAAAIIPEGPYPILAIHGEQGSAKSTLAKVIRAVIDPQSSPVLAAPGSTRDLMVTALSGWLLVYDNISTIPGMGFRIACAALATGGGIAGRRFIPTMNDMSFTCSGR